MENKNIVNKLQVFVNKCLKRILRIWWPSKISNEQLWEITKQETISSCIMKGKWGWMGHTWRKLQEDITRHEEEVELDWPHLEEATGGYNSTGIRLESTREQEKRTPKNIWKRSTLKDQQRINRTWIEATLEAQKRVRWRKNIEALCSTGSRKE
jgi:hypothetical protein